MQNDPLDSYSSELKCSQDSLVLQYMPALRAMAYRLKERLPSFIDVSDLISIGTEEMVKLSRKYDSSINDSFWGYAKTRVYGSMLDYLRGLDIVSRSSRKLIKSIDKEVTNYFNQHEEEPSDEYLAEVLNEDIKKIRDARMASDIYSLVPIDEQYNALESENTLENIQQDELIDIIKGILSELGEREQMVIQLYYFDELSLSEISAVLGITSSRISQIHKEVIKRIRNRLGDSNG